MLDRTLDRTHAIGQFARPARQAGEQAGQLWEDGRADRVARVRSVGVGRVGARDDPRTLAERGKLIAAHREARPHHDGVGEFAAGQDATKSTRATSPGQSHDQGFELVVGVMPGRDERARGVFGQFVQSAISERAGGGFSTPGLVPNTDVPLEKGRLEPGSEMCDEIPIGVRLSGRAKVVDDVGETSEASGGVEREGEGDRVGPAGARDEGPSPVVGGARTAGERTPAAEHRRHRRVTFGKRHRHREEYRGTGSESGGLRTPKRRATYRGVVELKRGSPEGLA